jgi:competence ComEA-like helix-hairpin-helix protein
VNRRERVVLLLLVAAFVAGTGVFYWKRVRLGHAAALNPIAIVGAAPGATVPDSTARSRRLDINQATLGELDKLPGIGPVLAARIVEYRQRKGGFRSVTELRAVSGIGEKRFSAIKDVVTVGSPAESAGSGR